MVPRDDCPLSDVTSVGSGAAGIAPRASHLTGLFYIGNNDQSDGEFHSPSEAEKAPQCLRALLSFSQGFLILGLLFLLTAR